MGRIVRAISSDASVVCSAIDGKSIVSEIERINQSSAVITAALGRLTMGASLLGFGLKGKGDTLTIRMDGKGPSGLLMAVSDSYGNVRSYVTNPVVEIPLNSVGKLDVRGAVGTDGALSVVKDLGLKEPYVGQVPIVSGEIAEDITNYLATSEQTPSVCALGVLVDTDLTVKQAGGFLIQVLPFASDKVIDTIEKNINQMKSVTQMLEDGLSVEDISLKALEGLKPNVLDDFEVNYVCDCSCERVEKALISLGKKDLLDMANEEETEICCQFCDKKYKFSSEDLKNLVKSLDK